MPNGYSLCKASIYLFNSARKPSKRSASSLNASGGVCLIISVVSFSCEITADFFVLLEWISKQNGARPIAANLFWTTERAAIFSATNSTRLPL